jgi:hypothetical protein
MLRSGPLHGAATSVAQCHSNHEAVEKQLEQCSPGSGLGHKRGSQGESRISLAGELALLLCADMMMTDPVACSSVRRAGVSRKAWLVKSEARDEREG